MPYYDPYGPATPNQRAYARRLGIEFDEETITGGEISRLIDEAKAADRRKRMPSERQIEFARNLGIAFTSLTTEAELSELLDAEIAKLTREALTTNTALREGRVIVHGGVVYRIEFLGRRRGRGYPVVDLRPYFDDELPVRRNVMVISVAGATPVSEAVLRTRHRRRPRPA